MKLNSIRVKLVFSLLAICIIPLCISGYGSWLQSRDVLTNKLQVTSGQTVSEVNNGLESYFKGFSNMVSAMASNDNLVNVDAKDNTKDIINVLKSTKESDEQIFSSYYGTETGEFQIYPAQKMPDDFKAKLRPWYKLALENKGKVVITAPFKDAKTGKSVVSLAKTVEKNGVTVGVTALDISLDTLIENLSYRKVASTGYVFIADIDGNIIAHPSADLIGTDEAAKLSFWDRAKSEKNGFIRYSYNGVEKFGVYETNDITGWKLIAVLDYKELSDDTDSILKRVVLMIFIMSIVAIGISMILSRGISTNIKILKDVFAKTSEGDLTVSIVPTTKDEFKDLALSFNSMVKNIRELMNNVTSSSNTVLDTSTSLATMSEEVTVAVGEVAKAIEEVASGSTNQAQYSQKGAEEMNGLSDELEEISANSEEMNELSINTKSLSAKGLAMIEVLIEKSSRNKSVTTEVNDIVKDMNESTKQIDIISKTISGITEQTNLLSLNASIEAARAGEAGKGFVVVADEIRKLAEKSKISTEEIKSIVKVIQDKSNTVAGAITTAENVVEEQYKAVEETEKIFNEILNSIQRMIDKVGEVKASIDHINNSKRNTVLEIENISAVSQETAAATEEVTASTEEITATMNEFTEHADNLEKLAEKLKLEVLRFKIK